MVDSWPSSDNERQWPEEIHKRLKEKRSGLILGPQGSSPNSEAMDLKKTKMKKKEKKRRPGICQIRSSSEKEKCQQTGKQPVFKHSKKAPTANPPEHSERCMMQSTDNICGGGRDSRNQGHPAKQVPEAVCKTTLFKNFS